MRLALPLVAVLALAGCIFVVQAPSPLVPAFAGADVAPPVGGEIRLLHAGPAPAGALGPVIGFPLRRTDVHARVVGVTVVTTIEQVFENPLTEPVDAVYVFPLGDRAAVSAYRIEIGARTIEGVIQRKAEARATYEAARTTGHTAALLEQRTANVFSQRLANLAPGAQIKVRFEVSEPLTIRDGQLELIVPLTVGPRYLPATGRGSSPVSARQAGDPPVDGETSVGYVDAAIAGNTVSFTAELELPVAPSSVVSPSHDLIVETPAPGLTRVRLAARDELPNRDLIIRFRTGQDGTTITASSHRADDGGYALLSIVPPLGFRTDELTAREVIILIDRSGSMAGDGLLQAQEVARTIVGATEDRDTINVLAFADDVSRFAGEPIAATPIARADAIRFIDALQAGGGTPLDRGVLAALDEPATPGRIRAVYLISDGLVGNDDVVVMSARGALGANRIYPVGIGAAPNRALLDDLARVGRGFPTYVGLTEPAVTIAQGLVARSRAPYLTDVEIDWGGLAVSDQAPAILPDVHPGLPLSVAVRYATPGTATVRVKANLAGRSVTFPATLTLPARADQPAVRLAWARARIDDLLAGQDGERGAAEISRAIEQLGLQYAIVTRETSFVAVDRTRVIAPGGAEQVIEAPSTVPEGVELERVAPTPPAPTVTRGSRVGNAYELGYVRQPSSGGRGGDADPITVLLVIAIGPLLIALRRPDAAKRLRTLDDVVREAPWTMAIVLAATLLTTLALAERSVALVAPFVADAARVVEQPWRLLTGPLIHGSWGHLARDLALIAILGLSYEAVLARWRTLVVLGLAVPTAAALADGAPVYLGLSGLSHALLGAALVYELRMPRARARGVVIVIAALAVAKVSYELISGQAAFPMDVVASTVAHAAGFATGAVIGCWSVVRGASLPTARARAVSSSAP